MMVDWLVGTITIDVVWVGVVCINLRLHRIMSFLLIQRRNNNDNKKCQWDHLLWIKECRWGYWNCLAVAIEWESWEVWSCLLRRGCGEVRWGWEDCLCCRCWFWLLLLVVLLSLLYVWEIVIGCFVSTIIVMDRFYHGVDCCRGVICSVGFELLVGLVGLLCCGFVPMHGRDVDIVMLLLPVVCWKVIDFEDECWVMVIDYCVVDWYGFQIRLWHEWESQNDGLTCERQCGTKL